MSNKQQGFLYQHPFIKSKRFLFQVIHSNDLRDGAGRSGGSGSDIEDKSERD